MIRIRINTSQTNSSGMSSGGMRRIVEQIEGRLLDNLNVIKKDFQDVITDSNKDVARQIVLEYFETAIPRSLNKVGMQFLSRMFIHSGATTMSFRLSDNVNITAATPYMRFYQRFGPDQDPANVGWTYLNPDYLRRKRRAKLSSRFFVRRGGLRRRLNAQLPTALARFFPARVGINITEKRTRLDELDSLFTVEIDLYTDLGLFSNPTKPREAQRRVLAAMGLQSLELKLNNGYEDGYHRPLRLTVLPLVRFWYLREFPRLVDGVRAELRRGLKSHARQAAREAAAAARKRLRAGRRSGEAK